MARFQLRPGPCCMAGLLVFLALTAIPMALGKTAEQQLADAITASAGKTSTYVLKTDVTLTKELPAVPYNAKLTIQGSCGSRPCVIDGAGKYRILVGYGGDCSITVNNLQLQNAQEGAIWTKCHVKIIKSVLTKNKNGALIVPLGIATWTLEDSRIEDNENGAALFVTTGGRGRVTRCLFRNNRSPQGAGGGVFIGSGPGVSHVFQNCSFVSNSAKNGGGAVNIVPNGGGGTDMKIYFMESNFQGNVATDGNGGAVRLRDPVSVSFCGCQIANRQNKAMGRGRGNDLAIDQSLGYPPVIVSICPEKPAGLSVEISPGKDDAAVLRTCINCGAPALLRQLSHVDSKPL